MNKPSKTDFKTHCKKIFLLCLLTIFLPSEKVWAQGCECVGCDGPILTSSVSTYTINVGSATNDNLADVNQGVCGVFLDMNMAHIFGVTITLTSPSGQVVTLIGPYDNPFNPVFFASWEISFLPCSEPVSPDIISFSGLPYNDQWSNIQNWQSGNYSGSYYPYQGCLEDFNAGTVSGDWVLTVTNGTSSSNLNNTGTFNGFNLLFCDEAGTGCLFTCDADAGNLSAVADFDLCEGDPFLGNITPTYAAGTMPDANVYSYNYIVSQNSIIENYLETPDFSTFAEGTYELCGLSFFTDDAANIPSPDGTLSVADLENMLTTSAPFCGDISDDCFLVNILPTPDTIFVSDDFCAGSIYTYRGNDFTTGGIHDITFPALDCDTTVRLTLNELPSYAESINQIICAGDTFFIENNFYTTSGMFADTLTSILGCDSIINLNLSILSPQANITPPPSFDCNNPIVTLNGSTSTGGSGVSYLWTTVGGNITGTNNTNSTTGNAAGKYFLEVTATINGVTCTDLDSVEVTTSLDIPLAEAGADSSLTCILSSIELDGTGSSVGGNFSYNWTTATGNIVQGATTLSPEIDSAGTYILTVTNTDNNCMEQDSVLILNDTNLPIVDAGNDTLINCNPLEITLDGSGSMGNNFEYLWTPSNGGNVLLGNMSLTPTVDAAGTYELEITNTTNGCVQLDTVLVSIDTVPPIANVGNDFSLTCLLPQTQIDATTSSQGANFSYQWTSISGGPLVDGETTLTPTVDTAGTYELLVINTLSGCTATAQILVNEDFTLPSVIFEMPVDSLTCGNTTVIIDAGNSSNGGDFTSEWTIVGTGIGSILSGTTSLNLEVGAAGVYQLEITNNQTGCINTDSVEVFSNNTLPTIFAGNDTLIDCTQLEIELNGSSSTGINFEYLWTASNGGNILLGENTLTPQVNAGGTYALQITDTLSGCSVSDTLLVAIDTLRPIADAGNDLTLTCTQPQTQIDGTNSSLNGPIIYQWTALSGGPILSGETSIIPVVDTAGIYELLITNTVSGCTASDTMEVLVDFVVPDIIFELPIDSLTCVNNSVFINATNSSTGIFFDNQWSILGNGNISTGATTLMAQVTEVGKYQLQITNTQNGCTAVDSIEVFSNNTFPNVNAGNDTSIICSPSEITLNGNGSVGGEFSYLWTPLNGGNILSGETTFNPQVNAGGDYVFEITNTSSGCVQTDTVLVTMDTLSPIANAGLDTLLNCENPSIILDGAGTSLGDFSYLWSATNGATFTDATLLQQDISVAGVYQLEVTNNQNACTVIDSVLVGENFIVPIAQAGQDTILTCADTIIFLNGNSSSQGSSFIYEWTAFNGGNILSNNDSLQVQINAVGNYEFTVTDTLNGCSASDTLSVTGDQNLPLADAGFPDTLTCNQLVITLDGSASDAGNGITYFWNTLDGNIVLGETTLAPQIDSAGTYTLTVNNTITGCAAQASVVIVADTLAPNVTIATPLELSCNNVNVLLQANTSPTGNDWTYLWTTNDGSFLSSVDSAQVTVNQSTTYYLSVSDEENGCTNLDSVTVIESFNQPSANAGMDTMLTCGDSIIILDGSASSMNPNEVVQWNASNGGVINNNTNTFQIEIAAAGTYELIITDTLSGCSDLDTVVVTSDTALPIVEAGIDGVLNCYNSVISLNGSHAAMGTQFTFLWTTDVGNILAGENTLAPTIDSAGIYFLRVTDTLNGCSSSDFMIVTFDTLVPVLVPFPDTAITCTSSVITLDATGSSVGSIFEYSWRTQDGNILTGEDSLTPEIDSAGTYQLGIINLQNGCDITDMVLVVWDTLPPIADAGLDTILTCDVDSVSLGGNSSTGNNFEYQWTALVGGNILSNPNEPTIFVNSPATYTLTILNNLNGCSATDEAIVSQDNNVPVAIANSPDTIFCNNTSITLDGSGSSVGANIEYSWTTMDGNILSDANSLFPVVDSAGLYVLTVRNSDNNCASNFSVNVLLEDCNITAMAGADGELNCLQDTLFLDGSGSSVGAGFVYNWTTTNGNILADTNTLAPLVNAAGTYVLLVENTTTGLTATDTVEVTESFDFPIINLSANELLGCVNTNVLVSGNGSSSGSNFLYDWSTSTGNIVSVIGISNISVSEPGFYIFEITNSDNGCVAVDSIEVLQDNNVPIAEAGMDAELNCYNLSNGQAGNGITLDGTASSAGNNFQYQWTTTDGNIISGDSTLTPFVDSIGTYILTVSDTTNGCSSQSSVDVTDNFMAPLVNAGLPDTLTCTDSILVLNGSPAANNVEYFWTTQSGNILLGANTPTPQVDQGGLYQLLMLDTLNGCSDSATVFIETDFVSPLPNAGVDTTIDCALGSVILVGANLTAGNNFTYTWSSDNGNIVNGVNTLSPEISTAGTYVLTIQNLENGCTATDEVEVTAINCTPLVSIAMPDTLTCSLTQITLDGSASSNWSSIIYEWTTGNGNIVGAINLPTVEISSAGDYVLTLTDTLNNESAFSSVSVLLNDTPPIAEAGNTDILNCAVLELNLDASASSEGTDFTYLWNTSDGNVVSGNDSIAPLINRNGTYELLVTNLENGCTATDSVLIEIDTLVPVADAGISLDFTCVDTLLQLNATNSSTGNNFAYEWTNSNGNIVLNNNTLTPQITSAGSYDLTVTNTQNFCTASDSILVEQDTLLPSVNIELPQVLNCTRTQILLDANSSSTGNNIAYQWQTSDGNIVSGGTTLTPQIDSAGNYGLTIIDMDNGCQNSASVEVMTDTISPIANAGNSVELTCTDTILFLDGSASATGNNFSYQWNTQNGNLVDGENSLAPNVNLPGEYQIVVTDNNNTCTDSSQVFVTQNITPPSVLIEVPDTLNCEIENIQINAENDSNDLIFSYLWSVNNGNVITGETTLLPQVSDGGQYYLFTTNTENGCATLDSILVVQDTLLPISEAGMPMTLTCVDTVITLDGTASSTGIEFSYQWISNDGNLLSGENTLTPQVDEMGIYQLETTNLNNQCTSMDVVEILENTTPPTAEINAIGGLILNCDVSSIVLDASSSSPFGNITFEWMTNNGNILSGQNAENPEVDLLGDYFLTITDVVNGCTTSEMVTITANFEEPIATILTPEILTCKDTVITLDGTGSSEGNEFSYLWTTTNGNIVSGQNNLTCGVNASGDYVLTILNTTNGCSSTATITVLQDVSVPFADAGGDYEFDCVQTELQLDAMASQGTEFSYEWTTQNGNVLLGENTLQPTVDEFGTYLLTVTNQENGCVANSSTLVTEDLDTPQEVLVNIIPPLCFGDFNASIEITGVIGGDAPYVFSFNQFSFSSTTNFSSLSAGVYSVTVKDASGCELTTEIIIENPEELQVELGDDLFLELGESSNLEALTNVPTNELDSVIWVTSDIFDCPTCLQQEIAPLRGTVYSVILINENGCVAEDALRVFVNNKKRIYIPNAFSPNGDGWNDEFMIFGGNGIAEIEQFQIFTRWGEQVFEQSNFQPNDANMGWDGFFKGKKMNPAVFVYFAKVKYLNGETEVFKGDLFLK